MSGRRELVALLVAMLGVVSIACASADGPTSTAGTDAGTSVAPPTSATTTTEAPIVPATTDPVGTTRFNTYWLRDCPSPDVATEVGGCRLAVGESRTTTDPDILAAAMAVLNGGPNEAERAAGLTSNIRPITDFTGVTVEGDIATVDYNRYFETATTRPQVAQVVYMLTQFPSVTAVRFLIDHAPNGATGTRPTGRVDVLEIAPPVLVEAPALGAVVSPTFAIGGTLAAADVSFTTRVVGADGTVLDEGTGTARPAATTLPSPFLERITLPATTAGPVTLVVTASDGAETTVPILIQGQG